MWKMFSGYLGHVGTLTLHFSPVTMQIFSFCLVFKSIRLSLFLSLRALNDKKVVFTDSATARKSCLKACHLCRSSSSQQSAVCSYCEKSSCISCMTSCSKCDRHVCQLCSNVKLVLILKYFCLNRAFLCLMVREWLVCRTWLRWSCMELCGFCLQLQGFPGKTCLLTVQLVVHAHSSSQLMVHAR